MRSYLVSMLMCGLTLSAGCVIKKPNNDPEPAPAPAQEPAPAPAPYVPPVPDAPAKLSLGNGATQGWMVKRETESAAGKSTEWWAIVGDTGDSFQVECVVPGLPADEIMGLTVAKADGKVTKAVLGKAGEAGKEHPIAKTGPGTASEVQGVAGKCTIKIGTFDAKKFDYGSGNVAWIGEGGDMQGVMLKMEGAAPYELSAKPTSDNVKTGNTMLPVWTYAYSNGMKILVTNDRYVAAFYPVEVGKKGSFGMEMQGMKTRVTEVNPSAKAQLIW